MKIGLVIGDEKFRLSSSCQGVNRRVIVEGLSERLDKRIKPQFRTRGQNDTILRPRIELNAQFGNYNSRIISISVVDTAQRGSKKSQFSIGKVGGYLTEHGPPPKSTYTVEVDPLDRFGRVTHGWKALNGVNIFAQPSVS